MEGSRKKYKFWWQPQWGKHEVFTVQKWRRWTEYNGEAENKDIHAFYAGSIAIVIVKDPYTWIKSMCKANYDFRYSQKGWLKHCPRNFSQSELNWLPLNRAQEMNVNHTSNGIFSSMIGVWNVYYES